MALMILNLAILSSLYLIFCQYPLYFHAFAVTLSGIITGLLVAPSIYHCVVLSLYTYNRNIFYLADHTM